MLPGSSPPPTTPRVGIVKLMGREAGFVAMYATLASNDVDICLIPEEPFDLDKLCTSIGTWLNPKP